MARCWLTLRRCRAQGCESGLGSRGGGLAATLDPVRDARGVHAAGGQLVLDPGLPQPEVAASPHAVGAGRLGQGTALGEQWNGKSRYRPVG